MSNSLVIFKNPENSFFAKKNGYEEEEFLIEHGDELVYDEIDEIDDDELLQWAKDDELLIEEEENFLENGEVNLEALRDEWVSHKKTEQSEYPSPYFYPSGRAFLWFESLNLEFPENVKIEIIDGLHPGDNSQHVYIYGYQSLVKLQEFLKDKGHKINFNIT